MLVLSVTLAIFLLVAGLLFFVLIRFRQRPSDSEREPAQVYGSNQIELSWTVIPILIVVMLFLTTTRVILQTEAAPKPSGALDVTVIGHQFWWEYRYPKLGVVTANELHVPISDPAKPTPTYLSLSSADTDHSFWVPRLAGKTDMTPFAYRDKGSMATIGHLSAVADSYGMKFTGVVGYTMWGFVHVLYLIGWGNRVAAVFNWARALTFSKNRPHRTITYEHAQNELAEHHYQRE